MPFKKIRAALASADDAADEVAVVARAIGDLLDDLCGDGLEIKTKLLGHEITIPIRIRPADTETDE